MNKKQIIEAYFPPPFDVLLTLNDPRSYEIRNPDTQVDYLALTGFVEDHIPHLIKMLSLWFDDDVNNTNDSKLILAPIHIWRILGQLRTEVAIEPLLSTLDPMDERGDDWYLEEYPYVFRNIGKKAFQELRNYLWETEEHELFAYICVNHCIKEIGTLDLECRNKSIEILKEKLELYNENDEALNASLISHLIDLKAVETAELIEHAYAANAVDCRLDGDWGKVKKLLGVEGMGIAPESAENRENPLFSLFGNSEFSRSRISKNKAKSKRRKAKKSHRKNRRKK